MSLESRGVQSHPERVGASKTGGISHTFQMGWVGALPPESPTRSGWDFGLNLGVVGGSGWEHLFGDLRVLPPGAGGIMGGSERPV